MILSKCTIANSFYSLVVSDEPGRETEFENKAGAFEHQANQIANTAIQLANAGGNTNRRLLDQIRQNAEEVSLKFSE